MKKQAVIKKLKVKLEEQLAVLDQSVNAAHEAAIHQENQPENKYDTRGLEASYLANAQLKRVSELRQTIAVYKTLPMRSFSSDDPIMPTALVELEGEESNRFYFIGPQGGGLKVRHNSKDIWVITPQSPLGQQLIGKEEGDDVDIFTDGTLREFTIVSVQ